MGRGLSFPDNKAPTLKHSIINEQADASLNKNQPYRIVVRIGNTAGEYATGSSTLPPAGFFLAAIRALRADDSERVLLLAGNSTSRLVGDILAELGSQPFPYEALHGGAEVREDGIHPQHLTDTLLSATRVVWGDPSSRLPPPPLRLLPRGEYLYSTPTRRQPYELVWTWCAPEAMSSRAAGCEWLPKTSADFEVQASGGDGVRGRPPILARSTWAPSAWYDLSASTSPRSKNLQAGLQRGEWMREHVCIAYGESEMPHRSDRLNVMAQADASARRILYPMPWPDVYAEYGPGFLRLDSQSADHFLTNSATNLSSPLSPLHRCQWHGGDGDGDAAIAFVSVLTMDNLFHALVHAVPTRDWFARARLVPTASGDPPASIHVLPHFTQYWPGSVQGKSQPRHFNQSVGWRLLVRSLGMSESDWLLVAARASELTRPGRCNCYRRVFGGHASFMPPPHMPFGEVSSRVFDFNSKLAWSAGSDAAKERVIFQVRRSGTRQMVNEDAVRAAVEADGALSSVVQFVVMEELPVMKQYALVSSSLALAGVHGMGLAWTMLLPSHEAGRTSCLEITGEWGKFARLDYYSLSAANGVHYVRLLQPNWEGCYHCRRCNYRSCGNVTANTSDVLHTLRYVVRRFRSATVHSTRKAPKHKRAEAGGCARHPTLHLYKFGGVAQMRLPCPTIEEHMANISRRKNSDLRD